MILLDLDIPLKVVARCRVSVASCRVKIMSDVQSRKWLLTINNPAEHHLDHSEIRRILSGIKGLTYWCMCDETGANGTYHTHLFLFKTSAIRFSTIKKWFPSAHIDKAFGSIKDNYEYILKEGKHKNTDKADTNHKDTFECSGEMPFERQGARSDLVELYSMFEAGMTDAEILAENPNYLLRVDKFSSARQTILFSKFRTMERNVEVIYIFGEPGTGKSASIQKVFGYKLGDFYRVTDYNNPFDSYMGEDVIVFEEFRGQLPLDSMLNYLDIHPVELKARYVNKQACYTKVFIISNISLDSQYRYIQKDEPVSWKAFLRRIHKIYHFKPGFTYDVYDSYKDYCQHCFFSYIEADEPIPF